MEYDEEDYKKMEQYIGEERHIKYTNADLKQYLMPALTTTMDNSNNNDVQLESIAAISSS